VFISKAPQAIILAIVRQYHFSEALSLIYLKTASKFTSFSPFEGTVAMELVFKPHPIVAVAN